LLVIDVTSSKTSRLDGAMRDRVGGTSGRVVILPSAQT
jgi:hypothetical protein